jgi:hypothetical protein
VNLSQALHTAARRYRLERHAYWCQHYSEIKRKRGFHHGPYSKTELATFPRYKVLNAIRVELERLDPDSLCDVEKTRSLLILAGDIADDDSVSCSTSEIAKRGMTEERESFAIYIAELTPADLFAIEPFPYRRVLSAEESKSLWSRLKARWQIPAGYWYPLAHCSLSEVVAFKAGAFAVAVPQEQVQEILSSRGIDRIWELREYGPEYVEDSSQFDPSYNGAEGYWSSGDLDWIVYASHEGSITVGGWLLQLVQELWPSWQAFLWTSPFD